MNTIRIPLLALCGAVCLFTAPAFSQGIGYNFFAAGRYHAENQYSPVAFEDGDWSYMFGLEIHEGGGLWQFAVDYADGGAGSISSIITPQINLNFSEGGVVGGIGVLMSYVDDEVEGTDWSDIYYQLNFGLNLPLGNASAIVGGVHWVFEDWDDVGEFDTDLIDYTVGLNYRF